MARVGRLVQKWVRDSTRGDIIHKTSKKYKNTEYTKSGNKNTKQKQTLKVY